MATTLCQGFRIVSNFAKSHDRANSQTQVRKDKELIALLQAELATHEKHITSLEDDLDITCHENKIKQDELDKQQLLLDAFCCKICSLGADFYK
ncbi:hypothetical protein DSO57_1026897 [Entomophthora muscae]|uniref:Uncharacterized protein n=1 Tax=Entomophthora muscae TaxID=34485 RepID=A0ACC2UB05_9FUNG|nr:hypothetical protein DSO57_1026897 [Entomophthora muscae]